MPRRLALATSLAASLATPAHGQNVLQQDAPGGVPAGKWEFVCRDGRLETVRIVTTVPGTIVLQVPADPCGPPVARQPNAGGSAPARVPAKRAAAGV